FVGDRDQISSCSWFGAAPSSISRTEPDEVSDGAMPTSFPPVLTGATSATSGECASLIAVMNASAWPGWPGVVPGAGGVPAAAVSGVVGLPGGGRCSPGRGGSPLGPTGGGAVTVGPGAPGAGVAAATVRRGERDGSSL